MCSLQAVVVVTSGTTACCGMPWLAADLDMQQHHGIVACGGIPGLMLICDMQRHRSELCEDPGRREGAAGSSVTGAGTTICAT
jgi:hypothetical protein